MVTLTQFVEESSHSDFGLALISLVEEGHNIKKRMGLG